MFFHPSAGVVQDSAIKKMPHSEKDFILMKSVVHLNNHGTSEMVPRTSPEMFEHM